MFRKNMNNTRGKLKGKIVFIMVVVLIFLVVRIVVNIAVKTNKPDQVEKLYSRTEDTTFMQNQNELIDEQKSTIDNLTTEIMKFREEEKAEELRRQQVATMQNPDIMTNAIASDEGLKLSFTTGKGTANYYDIIPKSGWLGDAELEINLQYIYEFRMEFPVEDIKVEGFIDDCIILQIPKLKPELIVFELDEVNSNITEDSSWYSPEFSAEDASNYQFAAKTYTKEYLILHTDEYNADFPKQVEQLKEDLKALALKLGYSKAIIEEY